MAREVRADDGAHAVGVVKVLATKNPDAVGAAPCRCPACNPIHGQASGMIRGGRRSDKTARRECEMCSGTKLVAIEVARRYLEHLQVGSATTGAVVDVQSLPSADMVKRRGLGKDRA